MKKFIRIGVDLAKNYGSSRILVGRFWVGFTILAGRM
jgi:hypothetical protein